MGFGLLFLGYLFAFGFTSGANYIVSLVGLVGSVFLIKASGKLSLYGKAFKSARVGAFMLAAVYLLNTAVQFIGTCGIISEDHPLHRICRGLMISAVFFFHVFMYLGIAEIASGVDDKKLYISAYRDFVIMVVYYLVIALNPLFNRVAPDIANIFPLVSAVLGLLWLVLSFWLTINAYMRICLPGDESMPDKKQQR